MTTGRRSLLRFLPILAIGTGLLVGYVCDVPHYLTLDYLDHSRVWLKAIVADNGFVAVLLYFLLYVAAIAFVFPAPVILTIGAGFLFGWCIGGLVAVGGATLGGTALFLAARSAFGDSLRDRAGSTLGRFAEGFRRDAFTYLLVLRLTPIVPVAALNIGPAFLGISPRDFVAATFIGIIPGAMVYAFLGSGLDRALKRAGSGKHHGLFDLLSGEMIVALVGLTLLMLLGIVLKRRLMANARRAAAQEDRP